VPGTVQRAGFSFVSDNPTFVKNENDNGEIEKALAEAPTTLQQAFAVFLDTEEKTRAHLKSVSHYATDLQGFYVRMQGALSFFHFANFVAVLVLAIVYNHSLPMVYIGWSGPGFNNITEHSAGVVLPKSMSAVYFFVTFASHAIQCYFHSQGKKKHHHVLESDSFTVQLEGQRLNTIRWMEYFVTCPLMSLILTGLAGQITVQGWLLMFGCNAGMIFTGYVAEKYPEIAPQSFVVGFMLLAIIVTHDVVFLAAAPSVPALVWTIAGINWAGYTLFGLVAIWEYREQGKKDRQAYYYTERLYGILSFATKSSLGYQAVFALA